MSLVLETVLDDDGKPSTASTTTSCVKRYVTIDTEYNMNKYRTSKLEDRGDKQLTTRIAYGELVLKQLDGSNGGDSVTIKLDLPPQQQHQVYSIQIAGTAIRKYSLSEEVTTKLKPVLPPHAALYNPSLLFYDMPTSDVDPYMLKHAANGNDDDDDDDDEDLNAKIAENGLLEENDDDTAFPGKRRRGGDTSTNGSGRRSKKHRAVVVEEPLPPERLWVQCDRCAKWRQLPSYVGSADLPKKWYCELNPDRAYADCSVDQEAETGAEEHVVESGVAPTPTVESTKGAAPQTAKSPTGKPMSRRSFPDNLKLYEGGDQFCSVCYQLSPDITLPEDSTVPPLVGCVGSCHRSFHPTCVKTFRKVTRGVKGATEWACNNCMKEEHVCFACRKMGRDGEEVIRCHQGECGNYFHVECVPQLMVDDESNGRGPSCGQHMCRFCSDSSANVGLVQCVLCPFVCHDRGQCRPSAITRLDGFKCLCPMHDVEAVTTVPVTLIQYQPYIEEEQVARDDSDAVSIVVDEIEAEDVKDGNGDAEMANGHDDARPPLLSLDVPVPHIVSSELTIQSFGHIILGDTYHKGSVYYPIGWKSVRAFRRVDYVNEIHNNGSAPVFRVYSVDNPADVTEGTTPDNVWQKVVKKLQHQGPQKRRSKGSRKSGNAIVLPEKGATMFGLDQPFVISSFDAVRDRMGLLDD